MEKAFCLEEYLNGLRRAQISGEESETDSFYRICRIVEAEFDQEWNETDDETKTRKLEREKRAIMGFEEETRFYRERIREILQEKKLADSRYPPWYPNLAEGVFAELYGLSGLAPWAYDMDEKYRNSQSAKLIGDRLYCQIDGKVCLQPQRIGKRRRQQLKRALLLATPHERLEYGFHEVYLHNGIRITIYSGDRTKEDQDVMVFRKYVLKQLTFDTLCEKKTIPHCAKPLFLKMIAAGFNVLFTGPVRSGKTTFLQVWQSYEDRSLEGLAIATDPETPWHKLMPDAPIMQLVADGKKLSEITKSLLRGDNDYILLEEMRDAAAFHLALDITSTGTTRSKATIHDRSGINVPYKMASKIREQYGGSLRELIAQVFKSFDYAIELCQDPKDPNRKIMRGIAEYSYDEKADRVEVRRLCAYDFEKEIWRWNAGDRTKLRKYPAQQKEIRQMYEILEEVAAQNPMEEREVLYPAYYRNEAEAGAVRKE